MQNIPNNQRSYVAGGGNLAEVCYELDGAGRVVAAEAVVAAGQVTNTNTAAVQQITDMMFDPHRVTGHWSDQSGRNSRIPTAYGLKYTQAFQVGHIIGAGLGGSNTNPINFMPQNFRTNVGGTWPQAEGIARDSYSVLSLLNAPPRVRVTLAYTGADLPRRPLAQQPVINNYIPTSGWYTVWTTRQHHDRMCTALTQQQQQLLANMQLYQQQYLQQQQNPLVQVPQPQIMQPLTLQQQQQMQQLLQQQNAYAHQNRAAVCNNLVCAAALQAQPNANDRCQFTTAWNNNLQP